MIRNNKPLNSPAAMNAIRTGPYVRAADVGRTCLRRRAPRDGFDPGRHRFFVFRRPVRRQPFTGVPSPRHYLQTAASYRCPNFVDAGRQIHMKKSNPTLFTPLTEILSTEDQGYRGRCRPAASRQTGRPAAPCGSLGTLSQESSLCTVAPARTAGPWRTGQPGTG